jgi:GTP cyclohydrolase I
MDSGSPNNLDFKSRSEMVVLEPDGRILRKPAEAKSVNQQKIRQAVSLILEAIGEDPRREGLLETPDRVARMWLELASGHDLDPAEEISCEFIEPESGVVIVKDISFSSTCEHHLLPFSGTAHIAYLPRAGRITGLSKLARVVDRAAKRLQVQERLTAQIAQALLDKLDPVGVLVMVEAEHSCMSMRGIKKPGARTITIDSRGCYRDDVQLRSELLGLLNRS